MAVALLAASLVVSCEPSGGGQSASASGAAGKGDSISERVIQQAYRAIGDRHLYEPDFRKLSRETFRGFAETDPALTLAISDNTYSIQRDGHLVVSRTAPGDPADGRAWGSMMADFFAASVAASPVLQQADRQVLVREAMDATTKQLDRNTRYADPEEARDDRFQRDGGGGIGITVERVGAGGDGSNGADADRAAGRKMTVIRAVQDDSPAQKAGLQANDQILSIDGDSMVDRALGDVVHHLRGAVGASVTLTVLRPSQGQEVTASLKRARIIPTTVSWERHGDVALIHLSGFNTATDDSLRQTLDKARSEIGPDFAGYIIDMRGNRGGLLDQAQDVTEEFIGDGPIFSTQGRHPDSQRVYRSSSRRAVSSPMVVLVNGNSASAAEIVAAALQDRGRAVVVGTTSYGKGTVQTVLRLPNEGELILTWSRLLAPSGYTWNELGVLPNICTAKVADVNKLGSEIDSNQATLVRWHAEREPSPQEVATLRKICPPGEESPERDIEIANRLLRDPTLYAHAVKTGSVDQAARP